MAATALAVMAGAASAGDDPFWARQKRAQEEGGSTSSSSDSHAVAPSAFSNIGNRAGKATTKTEVVADRAEAPMLSSASAKAVSDSIAFYEGIVAAGGWPTLGTTNLKPGSKGENVVALIRRLEIEGYLPTGTIQGEAVYTDEVASAVARFQAKHGLAVTGRLDKPTVAELNVPPSRRAEKLRANLPRIEQYSKDLGSRYIVVNVPALQLETVNNGAVYSRHNIIAGQPARPTPVVMTSISNINFNPYWNAPRSIVEKDIIPMVRKYGVRFLRDQRMRVYSTYNGPELDPRSINWRTVSADQLFVRQDPGEENAMATVKINFNSPFGIYLHDTPTKSLFGTGARYLSSGCVRVDQVSLLVDWILNGQDGWGPGRIQSVAETKERTDVTVQNAPQLRVAYLTAWSTGQGPASFRNDIYGLDGTGFVVGQPLPEGELSDDGQRYILKPLPVKATSTRALQEDDDSAWYFSRKPKQRAAANGQRTNNGQTVRQRNEGTLSDILGFGKSQTAAKRKQAFTGTKQTTKKKKPVTASKSTTTKSTKTAKTTTKKKPTTQSASAKTKATTTKTAAATPKAKPATTAAADAKKKKKKVEEVAAASTTPPTAKKTAAQ
ncbi:MAG: L,D-transpeptidase family protein [Rhizobiales bacterium]|nr:L,D-transpeptidase family protein [Hyphomicrobiales bacterium]